MGCALAFYPTSRTLQTTQRSAVNLVLDVQRLGNFRPGVVVCYVKRAPQSRRYARDDLVPCDQNFSHHRPCVIYRAILIIHALRTYVFAKYGGRAPKNFIASGCSRFVTMAMDRCATLLGRNAESLLSAPFFPLQLKLCWLHQLEPQSASSSRPMILLKL